MDFRETLSGLETPEQYADWLMTTLGELYQLPEGQIPTKFNVNVKSRLQQFVEEYFSERCMATTMDALDVLYKKIPEGNQQSFHQAIGLALHRCAEIEEPRILPVVEDLTLLIVITKAYEAFDGLLKAMSSRYITENQPFFYNALSTVLSLHPDNRVFDVTRKLVNSPNFHDGLLIEGIGIMIKCRPDDYRQIIGAHSQRIQALYGRVRGKDLEARYWKQVGIGLHDFPDAQRMIRDLSKI